MNKDVISVEFFRKAGACYDPADVLGSDWSGTILDIMEMSNIPAKDKIWAFCREGAATERQQHIAACRFAREVWHLMEDPRSRAAVEAKEAWLRGEISDEQLKAAAGAARATARAAKVAARAARAAAWAAVAAADSWHSAATWAATAAMATAWAAVAAADSAASAAAWAAWDAAEVAARAVAGAARGRQVQIVIEILKAET